MKWGEAYQIVFDSNQFVIDLQKIHNEILKLHDETDMEQLRIFLKTNKPEELQNRRRLHIEKLEDVAEKAGWWMRKVALSYMKDIIRVNGYVQWGLVILSKKITS
jgi:hypothetical protein